MLPNQPSSPQSGQRRLLLGVFHGVPTTKKSIFDLPSVPSALRLANQAIDMLEGAAKAGKVGGHFLPSLYQRRAKVELQAGHPNDAATDMARAMNLLQKEAQPGTFSSTLGRAYLLLARTLQAQSKVDEARAAARSAMEHVQSTVGTDHPDTRSARQLAEVEAQPR